jgi:hypothetical protein
VEVTVLVLSELKTGAAGYAKSRSICARLPDITSELTAVLIYLHVEVSDTVHLFSMDERKTNLMHLLYIFIVAVGDAVHVSGVFAHRQER